MESLPLTANVPMAFDIDGLFQIYNAFYGVANLSDSSNVTATIRYHTAEPPVGSRGMLVLTVSEKMSIITGLTFAMRSIVIMPLMLFTTPKTVEYLKTGSSAKQFYRLLIPKYSAYGFVGMVLAIVT